MLHRLIFDIADLRRQFERQFLLDIPPQERSRINDSLAFRVYLAERIPVVFTLPVSWHLVRLVDADQHQYMRSIFRQPAELDHSVYRTLSLHRLVPVVLGMQLSDIIIKHSNLYLHFEE